MRDFTRRQTLGMSLGMASSLLATGACSDPSSQQGAQPSGAAPAPGAGGPDLSRPLKDIAAEKGIRFGSAMSAWQINDEAYVEIMKRECAVMVAENAHKMYTIRRNQDEWTFGPGDALVEFAKANGLGMRGHALIWHHPRWMPAWVNETDFDSATAAADTLTDYVGTVAARYSPFIYSWDVVNEAVDDETGEYRETSFSRAMGGPVEVIDQCFRTARENAPGATLAYNDYMSWESGNEAHRAGVLRLLEELLSRGAPVDALGIQSHSNYDMPDEFTPDKQRAWRGFCDEVAGMGLDIYLTEFDINDTRLGPDIAMRDELIAGYAEDYLDLMLSYPQVKDVLMWGMVDKYSWLQGFLPREDDVEKRPTLYSSEYEPKPVREAVARALASAPVRE